MTSLTLSYFSELRLGVWALVSVRMVLQGQLMESLLDLALGGIFGHPQYVVVVSLGQDELRDQQNVHCKQQHRLRCGHNCWFWHLRGCEESSLTARLQTTFLTPLMHLQNGFQIQNSNKSFSKNCHKLGNTTLLTSVAFLARFNRKVLASRN